MPIAAWIVPVLAREHDWSAALGKLAAGDLKPRAALDLGEALEYVEPDRRRAIEAYELAGVDGLLRARELAIEVGWWGGQAARARRELEAAARDRDPAAIHAYLQRTLDDREPDAWVDAMRATACALLGTEHHRGFGLRLVRLALERAYEHALPDIPGHLALWSILNARAKADGKRRELLPLAGIALETTPHAIDKIWIGALATEICLRDANHPVTAGAYAEIVAEHAPEHPILRELVTVAVPQLQADGVDIDIDVGIDAPDELASVYAQAVEVATLEGIDLGDVVSQANQTAKAEPTKPEPTKPQPVKIEPLVKVVPPKFEQTKPIAKIAPVKRLSTGLAPIAPLPPLRAKRNTAAPVLAALRTPDRVALPPKPADPPNAKVRADRIAIAVDLRLYLPNGTRIDATSRDVSTSGLFVATSAELVVGTTIAIELLLPGKEAFTEDEYKARARVARRDAGGYGLELVAPEAALLAALSALK